MKSQDFKYPIPSMPNEPKERKALKIFRGDDVAERRKYGYGVITENPDAITKKPQEIGNHIQSLSPQRRQAYTKALGGGTQQKNIRVKLPDGRSVGMLSGGCQLQAQKKLYGENLKRWTMAQSVRSNLMANVQTQIRNDPKVAQRSKKWSQCMADKGYHYKSPPKAAGAVTRKIESSSKSNSELREWEIQVAVADAKCNRKVGWSKLLRQLREEYAVQVKKKYEPQILTFLKLRDEALKRARRVLGTS